MSELIQNRVPARTLRWHWLVTVSALTLMAVAAPVADARAAGQNDDPTFWIELGGQLERVDGGQERFTPPFADKVIGGGFEPLAVAQTPPRYAIGGEAKVTLSPKGSDWTFTAAVLYGRSNGKKHTHEQRTVQTGFDVPLLGIYETNTAQVASDSKSQEHESHAVVDFRAGKDVGIGLFGQHSNSVVSGGVRFAEFTSTSADNVIARPYITFVPKVIQGLAWITAQRFDFHGIAENDRSFRGIGPSLSWDSSAPITETDNSGITFDWGINAALLFGRQKSKGHHQTTTYHYTQKYGRQRQPRYVLAYDPNSSPHDRVHSVIVPNVGGFAGISLRWPGAKVSFGYRIDAFFGAMDGGIDTRKTYDRDFYGPFATISIGLGG